MATDETAFDVELFKSEIARAAMTLQNSLPGALVTLIIRFPTYEEGYVVAGEDDLDALADVIRRAKLQGAQ
jgi:hypothetical protein